MIILDGKELSYKIKKDLKNKIEALKMKNIVPKIVIIMIGNDEASSIYIKLKNKVCDELGVSHEEYIVEENTSIESVAELVDSLNKRDDVHGILIQSPVPKHLDEREVFDLIDPRKDVDGLTTVNSNKLSLGMDCFVPCTPLGIMELLKEYKIDVKGKNVVILGRSNIVGKPLKDLLIQNGATVTMCHSKTEHEKEITKHSDIVISAVGKIKVVTADMIKEKAIVIDVGINKDETGKIVGDVDFHHVSKKASYITKVPGGVGPMTVTMLIENIIKAASK